MLADILETVDPIAKDVHRFCQDPDLVTVYGRMRRRWEAPGVSLALVGAKGRGKTTVLRRLAAMAEDRARSGADGLELGVLAGRPVNGLEFDLDAAERDGQALRQVDLVVMVLQATAPAGRLERDFTQAFLRGLPAILLINKLDQCDEDDREEALSAIQHWFGGLPWQRVLLAGDGVDLPAGLCERALEHWWRHEASADLDQAHAQHCLATFKQWLDLARAQIRQRHAEALAGVGALAQSEAAQKRMMRLRVGHESLKERLRLMADKTRFLAQEQRGRLRLQLQALAGDLSLDELSAFDAHAFETKVQEQCGAWFEQVRTHVMGKLRAEFDVLAPQFEEFQRLAEWNTPGAEAPALVPKSHALPALDSVPERPALSPNLGAIPDNFTDRGLLAVVSSLGATLLVRSVLVGLVGGPLAIFLALPLGFGVFNLHSAHEREQRSLRLRTELAQALARIEHDVFEAAIATLEDEVRRDCHRALDALDVLRGRAERGGLPRADQPRPTVNAQHLQETLANAERLLSDLTFVEELYGVQTHAA